MDLTAKLNALGFANVEAIPDNRRKGTLVYKIRTANGWVYEKFPGGSTEDDILAWAQRLTPPKEGDI